MAVKFQVQVRRRHGHLWHIQVRRMHSAAVARCRPWPRGHCHSVPRGPHRGARNCAKRAQRSQAQSRGAKRAVHAKHSSCERPLGAVCMALAARASRTARAREAAAADIGSRYNRSSARAAGACSIPDCPRGRMHARSLNTGCTQLKRGTENAGTLLCERIVIPPQKGWLNPRNK